MDLLDLDVGELSVVERKDFVQFDFPCVSFTKYESSHRMLFNRLCKKEFANAKYMKIYSNAEYIVFVPTVTKDRHCFAISANQVVTTTALERFAVAGKTYKLHKTPKGFAIKLNDPIYQKGVKRWESLF